MAHPNKSMTHPTLEPDVFPSKRILLQGVQFASSGTNDSKKPIMLLIFIELNIIRIRYIMELINAFGAMGGMSAWAVWSVEGANKIKTARLNA